jgi:hypothetical protein
MMHRTMDIWIHTCITLNLKFSKKSVGNKNAKAYVVQPQLLDLQIYKE